MVKALSGYNVTAPTNIWDVTGEFDAVVMNPPFSPMVVGYKILDKAMGMADVVIALMPWLVLINSQKRTKAIMDFGLKSITHLPRSTFKGARVQCCILSLYKDFSGPSIFTCKQ